MSPSRQWGDLGRHRPSQIGRAQSLLPRPPADGQQHGQHGQHGQAARAPAGKHGGFALAPVPCPAMFQCSKNSAARPGQQHERDDPRGGRPLRPPRTSPAAKGRAGPSIRHQTSISHGPQIEAGPGRRSSGGVRVLVPRLMMVPFGVLVGVSSGRAALWQTRPREKERGWQSARTTSQTDDTST